MSQANVTQGNFNTTTKSDERCLQEAQDLMPEITNEAQKVIWLRVCAELVKQDRMKALFTDALQQYCYVLARMNYITAFLEDEKNGYTYEVKGGRNGDQIKNRPEMAERNELFRQWKSLVGDFGLSPSSEKTYINGIGSQGMLPGMGGDQAGWGNFPDS